MRGWRFVGPPTFRDSDQGLIETSALGPSFYELAPSGGGYEKAARADSELAQMAGGGGLTMPAAPRPPDRPPSVGTAPSSAHRGHLACPPRPAAGKAGVARASPDGRGGKRARVSSTASSSGPGATTVPSRSALTRFARLSTAAWSAARPFAAGPSTRLRSSRASASCAASSTRDPTSAGLAFHFYGIDMAAGFVFGSKGIPDLLKHRRSPAVRVAEGGGVLRGRASCRRRRWGLPSGES